MFGFAKNERDNVDDEELRLLRKLAAALLAMDERMVKDALAAGDLVEVSHGKQETA